MNKITLTDSVYPVGADLGNGFVNLYMQDRHAGLPAGYMLEKPTGPYDPKRMSYKSPKAQEIVVNDKTVWVGRDTLTDKMVRYLDDTKYDKEHLRILFSAGLAEWLSLTKASTEETLRLRVACGMPAEKFQDPKNRALAEKAYKAAFKVTNSDQWRITVGGKRIRLLTEFAGLRPETVGYACVSKLHKGYTVLMDCGAGTVDVCVFHSSQQKTPITVKSFNIGLIHAFDDINPMQMDLPELLLIRKEIDPSVLNPYVAQIKTLTTKFCRRLEVKGQEIRVKIIGGLPHLMSKEQRASLSMGIPVVFGDAGENARAFANYAGE